MGYCDRRQGFNTTKQSVGRLVYGAQVMTVNAPESVNPPGPGASSFCSEREFQGADRAAPRADGEVNSADGTQLTLRREPGANGSVQTAWMPRRARCV